MPDDTRAYMRGRTGKAAARGNFGERRPHLVGAIGESEPELRNELDQGHVLLLSLPHETSMRPLDKNTLSGRSNIPKGNQLL